MSCEAAQARVRHVISLLSESADPSLDECEDHIAAAAGLLRAGRAADWPRAGLRALRRDLRMVAMLMGNLLEFRLAGVRVSGYTADGAPVVAGLRHRLTLEA